MDRPLTFRSLHSFQILVSNITLYMRNASTLRKVHSTGRILVDLDFRGIVSYYMVIDILIVNHY